MGCKSKELSPDKKEVILTWMKSDGYKISAISRVLSIPESMCRSVVETLNKRKSPEKGHHSGRPRKMSTRGKARTGLRLFFLVDLRQAGQLELLLSQVSMQILQKTCLQGLSTGLSRTHWQIQQTKSGSGGVSNLSIS
ncbi:hypothetical protein KUTeg_003629 [Tegillarca granosa]|uniref:Transposase n=1 Tax=Tegillarca granosa TaxID=220873 RepID=A0ABQ9FS66_TEGGR|nr:hypothetical protein KUTeg_003629 [Tegillarca granosa]